VARLFVFRDLATGSTERSKMTQARFSQTDCITPHAGIIPGVLRETCIRPLGGDVRAAAAVAEAGPRSSAAIGLDWNGGRKSKGQRGRTGV
jgi:hypothetical protein